MRPCACASRRSRAAWRGGTRAGPTGQTRPEGGEGGEGGRGVCGGGCIEVGAWRRCVGRGGGSTHGEVTQEDDPTPADEEGGGGGEVVFGDAHPNRLGGGGAEGEAAGDVLREALARREEDEHDGEQGEAEGDGAVLDGMPHGGLASHVEHHVPVQARARNTARSVRRKGAVKVRAQLFEGPSGGGHGAMGGMGRGRDARPRPAGRKEEELLGEGEDAPRRLA